MHNLKGIDVTIPLETLTCVTGVSGSGNPPSSRGLSIIPWRHGSRRKTVSPWLQGDRRLEQLMRVVEIDHTPIGRTPAPHRQPMWPLR